MTKKQEAFARVVGLDIGYGDLKASNSKKCIHLPSVIGAAPVTRYSDEWSRDDGDVVEDDQGVWYVGEKALMHSAKVRYIKDRGRTLMPDYKRLLYVALGRLHPRQNDSEMEIVNVATGLPVAHMGDKATLQKMLTDEHRVRTQYTNGVYRIEHVAIAPQPYGTLFYNTLDEYGTLVDDNLSRATVLIVDVGRFTTNVITVDRMAYLERASDSINSGVGVIESHLGKHLEKAYGWTDPRPDFIQNIILSPDHRNRIDGQPVDFSDVVGGGIADLSEQVIGLVGELVGQAREVDYLIMTGGGSIILEDAIKERYPRAYLTENPVMANAIGFARYGRRQWAS